MNQQILTRLENEVAELRRTPAAQAAARKTAAELLAGRKRDVAELADLQERAEVEARQHDELLQGAADKMKAAEVALHSAEAAYRRAEAARRMAMMASDRQRAAIESRLHATAPAAIAEFVKELDGMAERTREAVHTEEKRGRRDLLWWRKPSIFVGNAASVKRRLTAIAAARKAAAELTLVAVENVDAEIEKLRASIPAVDQRFTETVIPVTA